MKRFIRDMKRWWRNRGAKATPRRTRASARKAESGFGIPRRYVMGAAVILVVVLFARSFYRFDRQILPLVLEAAELELQTEINNVINAVVHQIIVQNQITAADFIVQSPALSGSQPVLSVNTVLVNEINNATAQAISAYLSNIEPRVVSVPLGMALGLDTLAQVGPRFNFTMAPIGNALVNYATSFNAVGINQTHFSVWLEIESVVRIINPVQSSEIHVSRHVSLVDTIISGIVPDTYLHMDTPNLSLN